MEKPKSLSNRFKVNSLADLLRANIYPGRGIVIGLSPSGSAAMLLYFISGRSFNSRNRIFLRTENGIIIKPFDEAKVEDPSLIIYSPVKFMEACGGEIAIVTNGDQTDTIAEGFSLGRSFEESLGTRTFEPDAPNFTPRISGLAVRKGTELSYKLSILRSADEEGSACQRFTFEYPALAGRGHFISTYMGDGSPLSTFAGEPFEVYIPESVEKFASDAWASLNSDNKVSLYACSLDLKSGVRSEILLNKHLGD